MKKSEKERTNEETKMFGRKKMTPGVQVKMMHEKKIDLYFDCFVLKIKEIQNFSIFLAIYIFLK